jgi:hypothetical protein
VGGNKQDAAEVATFAGGSRQSHVSAVNGVESSAEQSNIHERLVSSFLARLASRTTTVRNFFRRRSPDEVQRDEVQRDEARYRPNFCRAEINAHPERSNRPTF